MNSDELYTLKSMVLDNYEQYHDGLTILLESDKGLYKAFGQSPRTKYLKTENFYLTSKERLTYMMGFIDALAWLTRQAKLVPDTFPTDIAGFTDPEETPEERAEYFEQRYKNWNSEWLILKCSYKVQKNKEPYRLLTCLFVAFSSNCKHFASTKPRNL